MIKAADAEPEDPETPQEKRKRFLLEFDKPFRCENRQERFRKKK
jgi:hypothetical protein